LRVTDHPESLNDEVRINKMVRRLIHLRQQEDRSGNF
jgi:hypothetical protein